jgi:hypothetical protein
MPFPCTVAAALAVALAGAPAGARATPLPASPLVDDPARLLGLVVRGEPSIDEVQRAAGARAAPTPQEIERWRRRARLAPLLPKVSAEYRHESRTSRVVGVTSSSEVDYLRETPGDTVAVRLAWDLEGLLFGRAELYAAAAEQRADARRRAAVERATRLYFDRLRLRLELLASPPAGVDRARLELDLEAITAELRALTGIGAEDAR